jgi:hypothetical protein
MKFSLIHENISKILRSPAAAGQALSPRPGVVIANSCQALTTEGRPYGRPKEVRM